MAFMRHKEGGPLMYGRRNCGVEHRETQTRERIMTRSFAGQTVALVLAAITAGCVVPGAVAKVVLRAAAKVLRIGCDTVTAHQNLTLGANESNLVTAVVRMIPVNAQTICVLMVLIGLILIALRNK